MLFARIDPRYSTYLRMNFALMCLMLLIVALLDAEEGDQLFLLVGLLGISFVYFAVASRLVRRENVEVPRATLAILKWSFSAMLSLEIGIYFVILILRN